MGSTRKLLDGVEREDVVLPSSLKKTTKRKQPENSRDKEMWPPSPKKVEKCKKNVEDMRVLLSSKKQSKCQEDVILEQEIVLRASILQEGS